MGNTSERVPAARIASELGVSRDTAIRMIQRGELEGEQTLTRWWATRESVDQAKIELEAARQAEAV